MAEVQHFKNLDRSSLQITHCSGHIVLNTRVHAASSWPRDSLLLILMVHLLPYYINLIVSLQNRHRNTRSYKMSTLVVPFAKFTKVNQVCMEQEIK